MTDNKLKTTIWAILIIFVVVSGGALIFFSMWIQPREGGEGVKIAVLDSGINRSVRISGYDVAKELKDRVILEKSFVTTEYGYEANASVVDNTQYYHGTLVSLQIASRSFGIAPQAQLINARCADADGVATYPALFAAIYWAAYEAEADIINISIGGPYMDNNTIVDLINQIATEKGVLTVVSAGNSGDVTGYSLSSIESPGDALQAITVGATTYEGIAEYSSIGPLKDHRVKPDLVDSGFTLIALGTSFSAPKVSAKAAVLLSWCRSEGYKTSPGLLKAALMNSASLTPVYPSYAMGAGIANVDIAKTIITQAIKADGWPLVSYIHPNTLPYSMPLAFKGDIWHFPITIITPIEQEFTFTSNLLPGDSIISIPSTATINQSGVINCNFIISDDHPFDQHQETINIESSLGESFGVTINVEIMAPKIRVAFDVYHSLWDMDHLFGQFNELRLKLATEQIALIEFTHPDNYSQLNDYDALILADSNTYGLYLDDNTDVQIYYRAFSNETINYIINFVESGHGLFFLGVASDSAEIDETNRLLNNFNVTILDETIPTSINYNEATGTYNIVLITEMSLTHPVTSGLTSFDYLGAKLGITGNNSYGIAWYQHLTNIAVAAYQSESSPSGRAIITGSNFMTDNWGINGQYLSAHNLDFVMRVLQWITNTTLITGLSPEVIFNPISGSFLLPLKYSNSSPPLSLQVHFYQEKTNEPYSKLSIIMNDFFRKKAIKV